MSASKPGLREWIAGARVRTLPLALSPVILGAGSAAWANAFDVWLFLLCVVVALALQVGVNYANDYSDGVRGTDAYRVGPARLTASGAAPAESVKRAAFISFGVALAAGFVVVLVSAQWWLLLVGAVSVLAAWFYTGGSKPYGYAGYGELVVFVFFGPVATIGTAWVMVEEIPFESWFTGSAAGFFAAAVLLVNNLRDIDTDQKAGKKTLAVRLGRGRTKTVLVVLLVLPYVIVGFLSLLFFFAPMVFVVGILTAVIIVIVLMGKTPQDLIRALSLMGINSLVFAGALATAIAF